MAEFNKTEITVRSDKATGVASKANGSNIDALAFNITLLAEKNPAKAAQILKEYDELKNVTSDTPAMPGEDSALANEQVQKILNDLDS